MSQFLTPSNSSFPRQQLPLQDKLEDKDDFGCSAWCRQNMDSLESISRYQYFNNAPLADNYDIAQGNFKIDHYIESNDYYDYVSAISQKMGVPKFLKHYDITGKYVKLLLGEYIRRPDIFVIKDRSPEATNKRLRVQSELLQNYTDTAIKEEIAQKLAQQGIDVNRDQFENEQEQSEYQQVIAQKYQEMTPDAIDNYMKYDYRSAGENWGNGVLAVLKDKFYLKEKEFDEFNDFIITGRPCCFFRETSDGFDVERGRPMTVFYDISPEIKWWQDGNYGGRVFFESKARVIDRYGYMMTSKQKEALYPEYVKDNTAGKKSALSEFFQTSLYPFQDYRSYRDTVDSFGFEPLTGMPAAGGGRIPNFSDGMMSDYLGYQGWNFSQNDLVQVTEGQWRSQRKIGQLNLQNPETGEIESHIVDETFDAKLFDIEEIEDKTFKETENLPNTVTWTWVTQIWEGIKINTNYSRTQNLKDNGNALYLNVRPAPFQFKGDFDPFIRPKLALCGSDFGKMIVDLLKPYQLLYNVLFNQAYELIQRNNGKFLLMDMNFLPTLKDWGGEDNIEKAMTIARTLGFMPVDSRLSNTQGANFSNNQMVDLDDTEKITRLLNLAMLIEQQASKQIGITPQREGQVQASETAYGTETAKAQSFAITEPYFEQFFQYKKRKLQMILDMAQFQAVTRPEENVTLSWITTDLQDAWLKITGTELLTCDLGIYADYSYEYQENLRMIKQLALNNNTTNIPMSGLIELVSLTNITDIKKKVEVWEDKQQKEVEAQREHEQSLQKQALDSKQAEIDKQNAFEASENQLDRQNKIQLELLKGTANEGSYDQEGNTLDRLESQTKLALDKSKLDADSAFKQSQLTNQLIDGFNKRKSEKEKQLSEEKLSKQEAKDKKEIEDKKLDQIEEQSRNQEKLAKDKARNDMQLAKEKVKLEKELKDKELELKDKDLEIIDKKIEEAKAKVEATKKIAVEKVKAIQKDTDVKGQIGDAKAKTEGKLGEIKVDVAKQKGKDNIIANKQKTKIKLKVDKIKGDQQIKDAKSPKKPTKK